MYNKIVKKYQLNEESIKVKFTMLELNLKYMDDKKIYEFSYDLGFGKKKFA